MMVEKFSRIKYILAFTIAGLLGCKAIKTVPITQNTVLEYSLLTGKESLPLTIRINQTSTSRSFSYSVGNEDISGQVSMTDNARRSAMELYHTFNGVSKDLSKATSIWISDSMYASLNAGNMTTVYYRTGFVKNHGVFQLKERQVVDYMVNNKLTKLAVLYCEEQTDKNYKLWVWDNPNDPMIFRINMGWELMLQGITSQP